MKNTKRDLEKEAAKNQRNHAVKLTVDAIVRAFEHSPILDYEFDNDAKESIINRAAKQAINKVQVRDRDEIVDDMKERIVDFFDGIVEQARDELSREGDAVDEDMYNEAKQEAIDELHAYHR